MSLYLELDLSHLSSLTCWHFHKILYFNWNNFSADSGETKGQIIIPLLCTVIINYHQDQDYQLQTFGILNFKLSFRTIILPQFVLYPEAEYFYNQRGHPVGQSKNISFIKIWMMNLMASLYTFGHGRVY